MYVACLCSVFCVLSLLFRCSAVLMVLSCGILGFWFSAICLSNAFLFFIDLIVYIVNLRIATIWEKDKKV